MFRVYAELLRDLLEQLDTLRAQLDARGRWDEAARDMVAARRVEATRS
jgi:hypothetical protein